MKPALTPRDRRRRDLRRLRTALVLLGALLLYAALEWPIRMSITDDTYIHLVYAKHFRDGLGLVFNAGQPVFGTTSPLWSMGLGWIGRTGVDLLWLARALSMLFGGLSILAFAVFLRRFLESWVSETGFGAGRAELAWALGTLAFALDAWLVRWSATGMETACATFLVVAGFASFVSRRPWGNRVLVPAAWWSLAALARPEASVLLVLLVLRVLLMRSRPWVKAVRLAWVALPIALVHGAWLLYALSLYSTAIPATLAAKTAAGIGTRVFVDLIVRQGKAMIATRGVEVLVLIAFAPALVSRVWVRRADHFVTLGWLLGLPLLYAGRGVPAISRYLVPVMPLLVAYAWGTLAWLAAGVRRLPALAVLGLALAGALSIGVSVFTYARYVVPQADAFSKDVDGTLGALGRWCRANTPPGTEIAIPDIGAFAYFADRPVVDLAGLVTPAITPLLQRYPYDDLVTNLRFEGVARPPYLIDRADRPWRMMFESPYASCLTPLRSGRVDQRGIQHPEPAYYSLYRIDWTAFDRMAGGERQATSGSVPNPVATLGPLRSARTVLGLALAREASGTRSAQGPRGRDDVREVRAVDRRVTTSSPFGVRLAPAQVGEGELAPGQVDARSPGATTFRPWAAGESRVLQPPAGSAPFWVRYGYSADHRGYVTDTRTMSLVYHRPGEPDTTVEMRWTPAELDTLRLEALRLRLFDLEEPYPARLPKRGVVEYRAPNFVRQLEIALGERHRKFAWDDNLISATDPRDIKEWAGLQEFERLLKRMMRSHSAYMRPPESR